jgi:drug/metabolite transporter superfamily protein YnfA
LLALGGLFRLTGLCKIGGHPVWGWMRVHKPFAWLRHRVHRVATGPVLYGAPAFLVARIPPSAWRNCSIIRDSTYSNGQKH